MEQYLLDFLEQVATGTYGGTRIQQLSIMRFIDSASPQKIQELDDLYWDWTSILATPDDWNMAELEKIILEK